MLFPVLIPPESCAVNFHVTFAFVELRTGALKAVSFKLSDVGHLVPVATVGVKAPCPP